MSKFGCTCGHTIKDQTDCLPYKGYIREDEDVQKPIELLAATVARYVEAREQGQEAEFIRQFEIARGEPEDAAQFVVGQLKGKSLSEIVFELIYPFWNNYDRQIYECEICGRLWVQLGDNSYVAYQPETHERHVLWSRHNHNPYGYLDE